MKHLLTALLVAVLAGVLIVVLSRPTADVPPMGTLFDPVRGLYSTALEGTEPENETLSLPVLDAPVRVVFDRRGVPHIYADTDRDAVVAFGFVIARDRLFQMDFLARVAAGRLSEVMGSATLDADRFLRSTGMEWGARKNLERIEAEGGIERDLLEWYTAGVNAYVDRLSEAEWPVEFRLIGYGPERYTPLHSLRVLQYMAYDLSYGTDDADYETLRRALGDSAFHTLYPRFQRVFEPIVPERGGVVPEHDPRPLYRPDDAPGPVADEGAYEVLRTLAERRERLRGTPAEGWEATRGKGSNNWAVGGERSTTGAPILAGDMHLSLSLPAVWYEVHMVTPAMNVYGVAVPGSPLPVEAFSDRLGWAFTNAGTDQIDHLALTLDASGTRYLYEGTYRPLVAVPDTLFVRDAEPVVDTLRYAHWGPVVEGPDGALAIQWTAHGHSRTLRALWGMNHAATYAEFEAALRYWDTPMQNILYADALGNIAIRSTGALPIRRSGAAYGLLDGSSDRYEWTGMVPFEELPHSYNPRRGYLTSTNQQPADSTYAYYLGHDWRASFRSLRIDALLQGRSLHSVADFKRYQADVYVVQRDFLAPLLEPLDSLDPGADAVRRMIVAWDGEARTGRPEPLVFDELLTTLRGAVWDEAPFTAARKPHDAQLFTLMREDPASRWFDVAGTDPVETARDVLGSTLEATAERMRARYGASPEAWQWGAEHQVVFRHLTGNEALSAFWRGPYPYPGFAETLSPAAGRPTTHSASWRMVVDFSRQPPQGYGVYPGGPSGNPFSDGYDRYLDTYLAFEYYELLRPSEYEAFPDRELQAVWALTP